MTASTTVSTACAAPAVARARLAAVAQFLVLTWRAATVGRAISTGHQTAGLYSTAQLWLALCFHSGTASASCPHSSPD